MASLRALGLRSVYRSDRDNILRDFYIPALARSVSYDRAVGYFSASTLSHAAQGVSSLLRNNGKIRLIVGGPLAREDADAIAAGYDIRAGSEEITRLTSDVIDRITESLFRRRLEGLSWLVACGRLEVRIAYKQQGMYHEKIGIMRDSFGDQVVFVGSANESVSALLPEFNFESINVFECWRRELVDHFQPYVAGFEDLWNDRSPPTRVRPFPEAATNQLLRIAPSGCTFSVESEISLAGSRQDLRDKAVPPEGQTDHEPTVPASVRGEPFDLRVHQRMALQAWKASGYIGILQLATGAGKTITAAYAVVRIFRAYRRLFCVVAVPYQNLADQWLEVLQDFRIHAIPAYGSADAWNNDLRRAVTLFQIHQLSFCCVVVVNPTLRSADFQSALCQVPGDALLWIGDECHHHGAEGAARALPAQSKLRLGLSATPLNDPEGDRDARIKSYYGPVVFQYGLGEAIADGILTPYEYHIEPVFLDEDEAARYEELSTRIARALAASGGEASADEDSPARMLLFERARLLGSARGKLVAFERRINSWSGSRSLSLVYCGDGSVSDDGPTESETERQIARVSRILDAGGWRNTHFTSSQSRTDRQRALDDLQLGLIDTLVAIRCLDEGIDLPACRTAFLLASSRNPRQFIQRRGRLLRRAPGKDRAVIYDYLVVLPGGSATPGMERRLVADELRRVAEFARHAQNLGQVASVLRPLLDAYDLSHHLA